MSDYKGLNCDRNVITSIKSTRRAHKEAAVMMTASEATVVSRSTEGFLKQKDRHIYLNRASENDVSQLGIEPGTSCTAGEYSMKRAIRTVILSCHLGSHLCCYSFSPSYDRWGIVADFRFSCDVRMEMTCLSRESNLGPPALQVSTL
jgi:hypothetical protein